MSFRILVLLVLLVAGSVSAQEQSTEVESQVRAINLVAPLVVGVGQYEKFELGIDLDADFNNPYDPNDIRLDAEFESPSGQVVTVPGFYYQDFTLNASSVPVATDVRSWRVRFTPWEVGDWQYRIIAATANSNVTSEWSSFNVEPSDSRGFIRIDERNPRYLAFDDGTPYFAIGENMAWSTGNVLEDYTAWLDGLSAAGGNFIRVWMPSWGFGIEWSDTGLGNYDLRQSRAYQLDRVFDMVADRDVYIMLTLINHGAFSLNTNSEWAANPFNVVNGGMLEQPVEFATNPEAMRLWLQRLRYIAARWGYSPNLLAWEWWNEVNFSALADQQILAPWIEQSAEYLISLDPYGHLITHSGSMVEEELVWNLDSMSFAQEHKYNMGNVLSSFDITIPEWLAAYPDRPYLTGEFGSPSEFDLGGVMLHLGLWAAPMHGAFGTGMTWWWDTYIHPNDLYHHFAAVAAFFGNEDLAAYTWEQTSAQLNEDAEARVYGLQAEDAALLWVVSSGYDERRFMREYTRNLRNGINDPFAVEYPLVENAILTVGGLTLGAYSIEIWDPQTGTIIETRDAQADDGTLIVELPPFSTDLAFKIKPA